MILIKKYQIRLVILLAFLANLSFASDDKLNAECKLIDKKDMAISFAIINDNYIAKWKKDENGNYFGADDFLTSSLLVRFYWQDWKAAATYNSITSRKFNFRYDLLSVAISKTYQFDWVKVQPELGLMLKGDLGGDFLQNSYHTFRAINGVHFPYSKKKGLAVILGVLTSWDKDKVLLASDRLTASIGSRFITDFVPSRLESSLSYMFSVASYMQLEVMVNGRFNINQKKEYSEMTRSGLVTALNMKIKTYQQLFLDMGFALLPTKNIQSDSRFPKYKHNYLPQFWIGLSWNTAWISLREYIDY